MRIVPSGPVQRTPLPIDSSAWYHSCSVVYLLRNGEAVKPSVYRWLVLSLLVIPLFGCGTRDDRIVAKAKALALAGKSSESLRLLTDYLARYPHSTEPRRAKILLAIRTERSEEALTDYAVITASQVTEDAALLHMLALGLIRDSWRRDEGFLRARAAGALAELADASAAWLLQRGLDHPDSTVRAHAAATAGRLQDQTFQPDLQRLLGDTDPYVRAEAAWAIGRLGRPSDRSLLRRALQDRHPQVRVKAAGALVMSGDRSAVSPLTDALLSKDQAVRVQTAEVLGSLPEPSAQQALEQRLHDLDPYVRLYSAEALA